MLSNREYRECTEQIDQDKRQEQSPKGKDQSMVSEVQKYRSFLDDTLRPDYLKTIEGRDIILEEKSEYEVLLISIKKILAANLESIKTRVNIGHHVFVNAEISKCQTVIVKMMDNPFAELPLERAVTYVENRIKILDDRATQIDMVASKIRAHIDIVLTSLGDYEKIK